jgi:hypothetical protein
MACKHYANIFSHSMRTRTNTYKTLNLHSSNVEGILKARPPEDFWWIKEHAQLVSSSMNTQANKVKTCRLPKRHRKNNFLVLKLKISFNLRHTIMGVVVKCSTTHNVFYPCRLRRDICSDMWCWIRYLWEGSGRIRSRSILLSLPEGRINLSRQSVSKDSNRSPHKSQAAMMAMNLRILLKNSVSWSF